MEWPVSAMSRSVVRACSPAGESNAACLLPGLRIWPPASQSSASQCHTVSSLPGVTYAVPYCLIAGMVSLPASAWNCCHVQAGPGEQRLVVDHGQVVDQCRDADHLAVDRGHGALARPEVAPVNAGAPDHLR